MEIDQLKKLSKITLAALGLLFLGAIFFYKERVFFGDASFILLNIINKKTLEIQEHRYGSFITQMVPYFGQKWHWSLKAVIIGYSVSFNLFYLIVAAILHRCRQYAFTILMGLYYFLFVSVAYFWTNNEVHQAVAWMFLLFGVTAYLGSRKVNIPVVLFVFTLLAFLTIFTHYVVIIPTIFLWLYLLTEKNKWPFSAGINVLFGILLLAIITLKFLLTADHSYDGNCLHSITHLSIKDIFYAIKAPVILIFIYRCATNYWAGIILFVLGTVSLYKENKLKLLAWTFVSVIGYFILMGLTYGAYDKTFLFFHIESEWASIGIIIATPFVFSYLPKKKVRLAMGLLTGVFLVRLIYLGAAAPDFTWRTDFKNRVLSEMKIKGIRKLALINDNGLIKKNILPWAIPEESLLMSAMNGDKPQSTFLFVNSDNKEWMRDLSTTKGMGTGFGIIEPKDLNSGYFSIDTAHPYQIMTYEELFK